MSWHNHPGPDPGEDTTRSVIHYPKVLVTGGSGFLGTRLLKAGGDWGTTYTWKAPTHNTWDLRRPHRSKRVLETSYPRYVIHLAKPRNAGIETFVDHPASFTNNQLLQDIALIRGIIAYVGPANPLKRVIATGTAVAYPAEAADPVTEDQFFLGQPPPPYQGYGLAKRMLARQLMDVTEETGLSTVVAILPNLFGPGDTSAHVIPSLIQRIWHAKQARTALTVWGRPDTRRSFLYVGDAAEALIRLMEAPTVPRLMNIPGTSVTMRELVALISARLEFTGRVVYDETKPIGYTQRQLDGTTMQRLLNWQPVVPFTRGLAATLAWHLKTTLH